MCKIKTCPENYKFGGWKPGYKGNQDLLIISEGHIIKIYIY